MRCEIKGFPMYEFDLTTGDVISKGQRKVVLKLQRQPYRNAYYVEMTQDGTRRKVSYERLAYAVRRSIAYDDLPHDIIFMDKDIINRSDIVSRANEKVWRQRQETRIRHIEDDINELQIMRRVYMSGNHDEAVRYIEDRKEMFVNRHIRKYNTSRRTAELIYCQALEMLIKHIDSPTSQVTKITSNMIGYMRQVKQRYKLVNYGIERHEFPAGVGA